MHISKLFVVYFAISQCKLVQIRSLIINKSKEGVGLCDSGAEVGVLAVPLGRPQADPGIALLNCIREVSGHGTSWFNFLQGISG